MSRRSGYESRHCYPDRVGEWGPALYILDETALLCDLYDVVRLTQQADSGCCVEYRRALTQLEGDHT